MTEPDVDLFDEQLFTAPALARYVDVQTHELNVWIEDGNLLPAALNGGGAKPPRIFTGAEIAAARIMASLLKCGVRVADAGTLGRKLADKGTAKLGDFVITRADS